MHPFPTKQQVCKPVTEMRCDIHLYTECRLTMTNEKFPSDEPVVDTFTPRTCTDGEDTVYHKKFEPNCTIEESKNCVQVWKTLANGEKVQLHNTVERVFFQTSVVSLCCFSG